MTSLDQTKDQDQLKEQFTKKMNMRVQTNGKKYITIIQ